MKKFFKKIIPTAWIDWYHLVLARLAAAWYGHPSADMVVIGVTGTSGKSTTVNLITEILEEAGFRVGMISTVKFKVADKEWLNDLKMTMPGRFLLQSLINQMREAGCQYVVIETSSEGVKQYRHLGVQYDLAVFTNLAAEHLSAHGGFQNYKQAKLELFAHTADSPRKVIADQTIPKTIVANSDDRHAKEFLDFPVDRRLKYGFEKEADFFGKYLRVSKEGVSFEVEHTPIKLKLLGQFDGYNALAALSVARALGVSFKNVQTALARVEGVPGRMELIDEGQPFTVLVDYGFEPGALHQVYQTINNWDLGRIIHVLGSTGGGRDRARRPILGYIAGQNAEVVVVTNEDPYDEDPEQIIREVAAGAEQAGKKSDKNLFEILDRREAIRFALERAAENDLVLITGKGAEQAMVVKNYKKIPWDDREVAREELHHIGYGGKKLKDN